MKTLPELIEDVEKTTEAHEEAAKRAVTETEKLPGNRDRLAWPRLLYALLACSLLLLSGCAVSRARRQCESYGGIFVKGAMWLCHVPGGAIYELKPADRRREALR